MKRVISALCFSILLAGCSQAVPEPHSPVILHPSWPDQIQKWDGKWEVKVIDNKAWVGMPFEESQEMRIWLNDVLRYIRDSNSMICYYRSDLKEPRCIK